MKPNFTHKARRVLKKTSPLVLTCIGAAGVIATAVLAVKATPKAQKLIEQEYKRRAEDIRASADGAYHELPDKLTKLDTIKTVWRCYVPAISVGAATITCIFGIHVLNRKQQASLTSAYALVSRQFRDYKSAVKELYGEEAHRRVMESLAVEKTEAPRIYGNLFGENFDFEGLTEESHLFYDSFSERYFEATPTQVLMAEYHVNRNFALNGGEISLSEFYTLLGMSTPDELKELCWFVCDAYMWVDFVHTRTMIDDGINGEVECWIIELIYPPTPDVYEP